MLALSLSAETMGGQLFKGHNFVCLAMVAILPSSLAGQEAGAAMLHASGQVSLNTQPAHPSSAIFPGALIETHSDTLDVATITANGFTVAIAPSTIVSFEGNELVLDHGTLQVNTASQLKVQVGCLTIVPVTVGWTDFDIANIGGKVTVAARKLQVVIEAHSANPLPSKRNAQAGRTIINEGEQVTREEKCALAQKAVPEARDAILNSPWAKAIGGSAASGLLTWVVLRGDDPASPSVP